MIISSIAASIPSLRVTNGDLLRQLAAVNGGIPNEEVRVYCGQIEEHLRQAGAEVRFYRDREKKEAAYPLLKCAIDKALIEADLAAKELDLLIYCGVGRGFLEPAMAYFVASDLRISCECFDVIDACMSWVRAVYIAYCLFLTGNYSKALVVNAEFNIYECGYPALLKIDSASKWQYTFPAFTIGEAATATVLQKSPAKWNFHFRSRPQNVSLCTLPLSGHAEFSPWPERNLAPNGLNRFVCFGEELSRRGSREMLRFIKDTYPNPLSYQKWFPHAATGKPYVRIAQALGLADKVYTGTFPRYGNLVSASIPMGLLIASQEGELKRGDHIVMCPISAGMSLALVDFIY